MATPRRSESPSRVLKKGFGGSHSLSAIRQFCRTHGRVTADVRGENAIRQFGV